MTGQMTRYNYQLEGKYYGKVELANGAFVALNADLQWEKATDASIKLLCTEKTELYGVVAYRFVVTAAPAKAVGFVDSTVDMNDSFAYDYATYTIPCPDTATGVEGVLPRVHFLQVGDEFVTNNHGTVAVGTEYGVTAGAIA